MPTSLCSLNVGFFYLFLKEFRTDWHCQKTCTCRSSPMGDWLTKKSRNSPGGGQGGMGDCRTGGRERKETLSCLSGKRGEAPQGWGGDPVSSPSAGGAAAAKGVCAMEKGWVWGTMTLLERNASSQEQAWSSVTRPGTGPVQECANDIT